MSVNAARRKCVRHWLHVKQYMFDVARLVEEQQALGEGLDLVF